MADIVTYKNKQGEELTEKELFKDRSDAEQKALKFFCGMPIKDGCMSKEYLTADAYQNLVNAKKGETDYKQKALNKLGIDEDMAKEINPVNFEAYRYEYPRLQPFWMFEGGKPFSF